MVTSSVPRLVIAAPSSGSGKTTVATGLMAAFAARGLAVSPHKVGPDYIDPGYHALASGRVGRNLDAYLCGPELVAPLFLHGARGCDIAVVEGVMGMFDGAAGEGELASTAHVAKLLRAPVVLVVDASSQSRSVAALVHGFASWDPEVRVGGVILNKVASDRHEALLREALESAGVPVFGVLRRVAQVDTPSRHLGLVPVAERRGAAVEAVAAMAEQVRAGCDLDGLVSLARGAGALSCAAWDAAEVLGSSPPPPLPFPSPGAAAPSTPLPGGSAPWTPAPQTPEGLDSSMPEELSHPGARGTARPAPTGPQPITPVIAVAGGPAFTFSYAEHSELLAAAGAEVVTFDPLRDEQLPIGTSGLVIGGGFPEVYAAELSANEPLRKAVAALAETGAPVAAECAGLLYLCRELDGQPMCGVLDASARMEEKLTLGYRDAVAVSDSSLAVAGTRMRGHEFHRTVVEPGAGDAAAWGVRVPRRRLEGFVQRGVHASYLHTHWASQPGVARRFVERCRTS
ncbi:cobyrinic acid a,c-diamide synthase [Streptomyces canus]|uniref:Hydrogenobyrinate a,c-diamide synthase n=1 Tax=Streptomyces canus TaxID=58343 RepID=A0AAW8FPG8_9ACTN|nr:cobyrinate a,c-diamide synthase [Streptomyces canus]MDQ0911679.1 cobyrinic acid a,c-diamide synthase [Streptomyces canus]MDQ1071660.1 cobyrinic acid a,c-diamide synthase [Streptomyces canus]